ncbi:MAG: hypothetical protein J0L93_07800 [Deltaproteobacteria bacterium]|nr:hypothetical protein [Deltaproteobacteria bacterium]
MKSLFLGRGKVNSSIAQFLSEDHFLDEASGISFDEVDWKNYLPAKVFVSPGIDPRRPFFKKISTYEVKELDFFCEHFKKPIIAITGTDGKSTLTTQLGEVLRRALPQKKIFIGGNLGTPMFEAFKENFDIAVLEISSFQAERLKTADLHSAILINLASDHLDRYDSLEDYYGAKWHLLSKAKQVFFPTNLSKTPKNLKNKAAYKNEDSLLDILKNIVSVLAQDFQFEVREKLFEDLPKLPHRLQAFRENVGRRVFVNDSKATTVHATLYALQQLHQKYRGVFLILGGKSKGESFRPLLKELKSEDKLFIVGEARDILMEQTAAFAGSRSIFLSLSDLLQSLLPELPPDTCLILSPACSSYDEFENFEERGDFFLQKVRERFSIEETELV